MDTENETLGASLQRCREAAGLSLEQVATKYLKYYTSRGLNIGTLNYVSQLLDALEKRNPYVSNGEMVGLELAYPIDARARASIDAWYGRVGRVPPDIGELASSQAWWLDVRGVAALRAERAALADRVRSLRSALEDVHAHACHAYIREVASRALSKDEGAEPVVVTRASDAPREEQ